MYHESGMPFVGAIIAIHICAKFQLDVVGTAGFKWGYSPW
jgi:hypothetical protein